MRIWNAHKIRTEAKREHAARGTPIDNYIYYQGTTYRTPVPVEFVDSLLAQFDHHQFDENQILPLDTMAFCASFLQRHGFGDIDSDTFYTTAKRFSQRMHTQAYLALREAVSHYMDVNHNTNPVLSLL